MSDKLKFLRTWIIDTGESNHVRGNMDCLTNVHDILTSPVGRPDGQRLLQLKKELPFLTVV